MAGQLNGAGTPADPKEGERMNLAEHSFDCPVKYEGEHEPRVCAADDGKADAHEREIDWYERHLKQAQQERDEARAEVARLRAEIATWGRMWDDVDLLSYRAEALRNGTAILGAPLVRGD